MLFVAYSSLSDAYRIGQAPIYTTKVHKLLRSFEASSQKFSEYIQNGCIKKTNSANDPFGAAKRVVWIILASLRQPLCIYSENF